MPASLPAKPYTDKQIRDFVTGRVHNIDRDGYIREATQENDGRLEFLVERGRKSDLPYIMRFNTGHLRDPEMKNMLLSRIADVGRRHVKGLENEHGVLIEKMPELNFPLFRELAVNPEIMYQRLHAQFADKGIVSPEKVAQYEGELVGQFSKLPPVMQMMALEGNAVFRTTHGPRFIRMSNLEKQEGAAGAYWKDHGAGALFTGNAFFARAENGEKRYINTIDWSRRQGKKNRLPHEMGHFLSSAYADMCCDKGQGEMTWASELAKWRKVHREASRPDRLVDGYKFYPPEKRAEETLAGMSDHYARAHAMHSGDWDRINSHMTTEFSVLWTIFRDDLLPKFEDMVLEVHERNHNGLAIKTEEVTLGATGMLAKAEQLVKGLLKTAAHLRR